MRTLLLAGGVLALASFAAPALGDTSSREVQSAVDAYLASSKADTSLVGGAGQAGYDGGFWIRGGSFLMKINLTLQTRWEGFDWDDTAFEPGPGGDLSGFSLPRATLKFSGDATCDVHYYAELEFGHSGDWFDNNNAQGAGFTNFHQRSLLNQTEGDPSTGYGTLREGWIEYETSPYLIFRMGLVKTPTTRQLMTPPEMQQFVDVSMASAFIGQTMPGYTDRNRDYGALLHGAFGCDGEFQYMVAITNGDGPVHRNVLDGTTDDCFAYSARVNWDIKGHLGYEEGALRSHECEWAASIGAWVHYFTDAAQHNPFAKDSDKLEWGVDAAFAWGGFSFTAAYNSYDWEGPGGDVDGFSWFAQAGYLFPGTAWELAARYGAYEANDTGSTSTTTEVGVAVNYYIDGHADKVTLDVAFLSPDDFGNIFADTYTGYSATGDSDAVLVRLQWQLAL
ncbi:MAG: porin [Planctomycetia bacterium]|nr:porin [Planctomycetia bacterium]